MRLSYSLGSMLSINQIIDCAKVLSKNEPDTIWIPETWGMENFSMLSAVSQIVKKSKIGSSIINVYSRSPSLIAMGAVTIDTLSNGRFVLGLGTSSVPIVENFHGLKFSHPLSRLEEYAEIIRDFTSGKKIEHDGKYFSLRDFALLIKPPRQHIPIYFAAVNKKMVELAWEIADGVIFYLRPISELKATIQSMQKKRNIDVTCQIITCMSKDAEKAITRAKKTLAFYISVGSIYREFLAKNGFANETNDIFQEYKKSGLKTNYQLVTDSMLKSLTICGTPNECMKQLERFRDTGIDLPIIQFNPVDDLLDSFKLLTSTLSYRN